MVKYILDPNTFLCDSGLLYKINKEVLHPLGLALQVTFQEGYDEVEKARRSPKGEIAIWDCRDEGIEFAPETDKEGARKYEIWRINQPKQIGPAK